MKSLLITLTIASFTLFVITMIGYYKTLQYLDTAMQYIEALETTYPDYIDTVSGCDEYSNYYEWCENP